MVDATGMCQPKGSVLMKWLYKLERRYGRYAIRDFMKYIIMLNAVVFVLMYFLRLNILGELLALNPEKILQGEVWRLVTFVFLPPARDLLWIALTLYFYYFVGSSLEGYWGSFKLNVYYILGMLGTVIGAFIVYFTYGAAGGVTGTYINLSLFLAMAKVYPDHEIRIYFIIPVKMKYLGWLYWGYLGYTMVTPLPLAVKIAALISLVNYFIFFGGSFIQDVKVRNKVHKKRKQFHTSKVIRPEQFTIHRCTVCGITERDNPDMDFRYCSTCEGDYEYCMDHLKNHTHIKKNPEENNN